MRPLALLIATSMLAGCQTVNSTWHSVAGSDAPAQPQSTEPQAAAAPAPQTAMVTPTAPSPGTLKGQSAEALHAMWGEPSLKRKDLGSEMWQYAGKGCTLLVYLYPSNGTLTVSHAEAVPGGAGNEAIAACAKATGKEPVKPS